MWYYYLALAWHSPVFFLGTLTVFQQNLKELEVSDMIFGVYLFQIKELFWNIILAVYQSSLLIKIKHLKSFIGKYSFGASLVLQWLRTRLPVQGHEFNPWSRKILHAGGQLSRVPHYWTWAVELESWNYWAQMSQLMKPSRLRASLHHTRGHRDGRVANHS